jgi:mRNA-degrading endonuclease RelE of RelBE toxin-antitoxin system
MKRKIIETQQFSKTIDTLLRKRQLLQEDFKEFKRVLAEHPEMGDLISGTGGLRKIRLKSASRGKSGSFRVCYYFFVQDDQIFLLLIYPKNIQENLTMQQKKELKQVITIIRGKNG